VEVVGVFDTPTARALVAVEGAEEDGAVTRLEVPGSALVAAEGVEEGAAVALLEVLARLLVAVERAEEDVEVTLLEVAAIGVDSTLAVVVAPRVGDSALS
jgi:hypothetical protein